MLLAGKVINCLTLNYLVSYGLLTTHTTSILFDTVACQYLYKAPIQLPLHTPGTKKKKNISYGNLVLLYIITQTTTPCDAPPPLAPPPLPLFSIFCVYRNETSSSSYPSLFCFILPHSLFLISFN